MPRGRMRSYPGMLATWLLLIGCAWANEATAQEDGLVPHEAGSVHRHLAPPCANPLVYIGSSDKALHDALRSMVNCERTIVFTEPGATFAPIDGFYRLYGNLTLDASGISPGVTLGSASGSYSFIFQKGSSNDFHPGLTAKNINFSDNNLQRLGLSGGAFMMGALINFLHGGTAVFEHCSFSRNHVAFETTGWGAVGGAIMRLQHMAYTRFERCFVEDNDFSVAASSPAQGLFWIQKPMGPTVFSRCMFRNNRVTASPGVASTGVFLDSDLTQAQPVTFASCVFEGNKGQGQANVDKKGSHVCGAVCSSTNVGRTALDVAFIDSTFTANRLTAALAEPMVAADVHAFGAAVGLHLGATAAFTSCTFTDNAVLNTASAAAPGSTANTFRAFGGAVYLNGVTASIEATIFIGNSATGAVDARGGALGLWTSSKTIPSSTAISNTFISSNKALATGTGARMALGGGIATACATTAACSLSLTFSRLESNMVMLEDSTITDKTVLAQGGGLYATALRTAMTIDGSALNSNVAFARPASPVTTVAVEGGGLFMLDTIAHVASTAFSENSAWADNAAPAGSRVGGGGAAVITETKSAPSALTLTSASFLLNTAGGVPRHLGGALYKDLPSQLEQGDSEVVQMVGDADVQYKSFNDVNLGELPTLAPTAPPPTRAPTVFTNECLQGRGAATVSSPLVLGAATRTNVELLHSALSGWRQCHGRVVFIEPAQTFTLTGGYIFGGNLTLDASGLAQPVTLRTTAPMEKSFLSFVPNSPGLTPSIVARNIAFAGHRLVRTGASEGDWSMGGVISMQGGHSVAVFESCAFRDNELFFRSSGSGGCGVAGVRVVSPVLARFDDCVFESNTATCQANNAAGGAVGIVDPVGPVSFTRCRWTNNKVTATIPLPNSRPYSSGAAVFLQNEQPATQPVSFTECVFEENEAHVAPHNMVSNIDTTVCGAVCGDTHVGKPVLLNMTFARCSFTGNTATARLPADAQDTAKTRLTAYGAAVGLMVGSTARFTDCLIKHNVARVEGISSVTGHVNRAYGGGVLLNGAAASFEGTHFLDNSAVSPVDARGGALYTTGANNPALAQGDHALIIVRSTFSGNRAMAPGPAGRSAYGGALGVACTSTSKTCRIPVHMADCRVLENSARLQVTVATGAGAAAYARGGGLYFAMPKATITLLTSNFSNNTAYGGAAEPAGPLVVQGGGLYLQDATANVSSAVFLQNTAWVELAHEELSEAAGGGLALVTYQITGGSTSVLGLAHALFVLNSVGGAPRNFGGALYKDLPSVLEQVDVRVVPTEMELAGTEEEAHTSLNDVVLVAPTLADESNAPTAAPSTSAPTPQPTQAPSTSPTPSPALPLNCAVTWPSDWSACSAECGLGVQTQTGVVTQKPSATGAPCPESLVRIRSCQLRNCLGTAILRSGAALGCSDIVNAQEKVVLGVALPASATAAAGRGLLEEQSDLTFVWSGGDGHLDLGDAEAVASWLLTPVTARQLAFKPRALQPGHTYNFACTVSNGVEQTTSKISFAVNRPPSGGSFAVTPTRGTALETPFELAARNWVDAEGHYPLRYRFSLGAEGLALQSASTRASYNGVLSLPTGGASAASVPVTCTVEDSLGATTTVTQAVRIEPPALALSDPASFLADQTAAAQKLLAQKDGAVPGSATLVRALLLLLQCADVLNDPRVTRSMDAQAAQRGAILKRAEQASISLEQWAKGRSGSELDAAALADALLTLTSIVRALVKTPPGKLTATSQDAVLRVLDRNVGVQMSMDLTSPSPATADAVVVETLSDLVGSGILATRASTASATTEVVDRILGRLHTRRAARMVPGEATAAVASSKLALLSSVFLVGSDAKAVEVAYEAVPMAPVGHSRMRHLLSIARGTQAISSSSSSSKWHPKVTLPAGLLQFLDAGGDCDDGKASLRTTVWKEANPYQGQLPGGLALGATPQTSVVSLDLSSCAGSAPLAREALKPEEEVAIAFPATRLPAELVQVATQPPEYTVTCVKDQPSSQTIQCPYVAGAPASTVQQGPLTIETAGDGQYTLTCSGAATNMAAFTCPELKLESQCLLWDEKQRSWSGKECRVATTTLPEALLASASSDSSGAVQVQTTCSCQRMGAVAATVNPRLANVAGAIAPFHITDISPPITQHDGPDGEAASLPPSSQAAALFLVFLAVFHLAAFLMTLLLHWRWGQTHHFAKHTAALLQSKGAKRLVAALVEAEAARKRRWSVNGTAPATAVVAPGGGGGPQPTTPRVFDSPVVEKLRAYDRPQQAPPQAGAEEARRAMYEADQLYVAAQDRQRFFHALEKGPTTQQLMAEVAYHEVGALLASLLLQQQHPFAFSVTAAGEQGGVGAGEQQQQQQHRLQQHPAGSLHMTIRPLASGSAAANASAAATAAAQPVVVSPSGGARSPACGTGNNNGGSSPSALLQASLMETHLRRLDLQRTVIFVVRHLILLLVCVGRFEPTTSRLGEWVLRDCAEVGAGVLSPSSVCLQPQQFIFRNLIQFVLLLPVLLLLYILLPVAIQRPRRRDNAWLRIWTDKTILSPSSSSSSSPSQPTHDDRNNSEQLVSKERLSGEPVSHLLAIEAELDVLCASLGAVPPADAESVEAIDEARREVMLAAWRRRATETTTGLCWPRLPSGVDARDRLRALGKIVDRGDDPFKAFDRLVLTFLIMGGSRLRAVQQWLKVLFYRLALTDRNPMEGEVESERSFAITGLVVAVVGGVLLLVFLLGAVSFIVSSAIGWRLASAGLVLIYYVESVAFTALVTMPLSLFLRNTGLQLLAGALEADLHILRTYLRDVRHARAAALGDAAYLALLAQSPHENKSGDGADPDASAYFQQATLSPVGESSTTSLPPASPQTPQERQWWAVNGQGRGGRNDLRRGGGDREMI